VLRTCLHCALLRALEAEGVALERRRLVVVLGRSDPVWLPISGTRIYRGIRKLLGAAMRAATDCRIRIAVVDLAGKPQVDVLATVLAGRRADVHRVAFPRVVGGTLAGGFVEIV